MLEAVEAEQRTRRAETMNEQPSEKIGMSVPQVGDAIADTEDIGRGGPGGEVGRATDAPPSLPSK